MEQNTPKGQGAKAGAPRTLTFNPAVQQLGNGHGTPLAAEDQAGKGKQSGPVEEPFIRPSNELQTIGCVEDAGSLMLLHPPAQPELMPANETIAAVAFASTNSGGRQESTSNGLPSFGSLVLGLQKQQDYIRMQQHHLQEMSRSLDNVLHGTPDYASTMASAGAWNGMSAASASGNSGILPGRKSFGARGVDSNIFDGGKLNSFEAMPSSGSRLEVGLPSPHFARRVSPGMPLSKGEGSQQSSMEVTSERMHFSAAPSDLCSTRTELHHGDSQRVLFTYSLRPKIASAATEGTEVTALSEASEKHGMVTQHVITRVASDRKVQASKLAARLQVRLGIHNVNSMVTARRLRNTLTRLGSTKYTVEDLKSMLLAISMHSGSIQSEEEECSGVPFKDLVRFFLDLDDHRRHITIRSQYKEGVLDMMLACREILVAGDTNRLVAELTQVGVDEIAQRAHTDHMAAILEPVMSFIIVLNSISIGLHANSDITRSDGIEDVWFWVDNFFTTCFLFELLFKLKLRGCRWFWRGPDLYWNLFDFILVILGLMDTILTLGWEANPQARTFGAIRVIRLTRLTRLFRVFRAKHLKELSLMVKGTMAGMRTLFWAILLLMFTVYVLGIFATATLSGSPPELAERDMFRSVPLSMFTVFRCLMGDCEDEHGRPLVFMYYQEYGLPFVIAYVFSMVMVVFGLFNLIFAIYIETTLEAAKTQRKMDRTESVRIARHTRELLKKFALAHSLLEQQDPTQRDTYGDTHEFAVRMQKSGQAAEIDEGGMKVSRELFELVLKDQEVQSLMDALDISPDRTHLFDIIDADGSGTIEPAELIQGLLQVRGEAKKSDVVANLLAVRAVQNMIRQLERDQADHREQVAAVLQQLPQRRHDSIRNDSIRHDSMESTK